MWYDLAGIWHRPASLMHKLWRIGVRPIHDILSDYTCLTGVTALMHYFCTFYHEFKMMSSKTWLTNQSLYFVFLLFLAIRNNSTQGLLRPLIFKHEEYQRERKRTCVSCLTYSNYITQSTQPPSFSVGVLRLLPEWEHERQETNPFTKRDCQKDTHRNKERKVSRWGNLKNTQYWTF